MKTLVVLSALASIALAAPTLQEDGFENTHHVPNWHIQVHPGIPEPVKRDKKSPSELTTDTIHTGAPNTDVHNDAAISSLMGRSLALKKPVIVKKKFGYRLYRDSEEEKAHADSHESCGRQVKVKLCDEDGKFREMLRSSAHEISNVHTPADDMKLSIKMAKEAVENLQRDLMKMESRNTAMKMAHNSESDSDLHDDIEVARQALEHIHTNFGDLETMSLHATASRDSEALHDIHVTVAQPEQEKMAQWKEAMENIKKNVEIARNIEDSFKSGHHQAGLLHLDEPNEASMRKEHTLEDTASHLLSIEDHDMRAALPVNHNMQTAENEHIGNAFTDKTMVDDLTNIHDREAHHLKDDMNPSASEAIEMKTIDINNHHTFRSENHKHHEHEKNAEIKMEEHEHNDHNTELQVAAPKDAASLIQHQPLPIEKDAEEHTDSRLGDKTTLFKSSENMDSHKTSSTDSTKTTGSSPVKFNEHQRNIEENALVTEPVHPELHESTSDEHEHVLDLHAKSVNHKDDEHKETNINTEMGKAAEKSKFELESHHTESFETKPKEADTHTENKVKNNQDSLTKSVQDIHMDKFQNDADELDNSMRDAVLVNTLHSIDYNESDPDHVSSLHGMKSAEHPLHNHLPLTKSAEHHLHHIQSSKPNEDHSHHHFTTEDHLHHHSQSQKAAEHHLHHHMPSMKSAESDLHNHGMLMSSAENQLRHLETSNAPWIHEHRHLAPKEVTEEFHGKNFNGIDHMRSSHPSEHRFTPHKMEGTHDFEMSQHAHQHAHTPVRYHHHQTHDIGSMSEGSLSSKYHSSMRDAMDGFGSEHMYRWAPTHEYRNAYGSGLSGSIGSSSGGAVGVFPNANTGGCGIPLLLSCSPSVVSGSLAKAHPSQGQGSYAGPSYRSEDEFGFHNKRDIKKTNEMRSTTVLRTPAIIKQKTMLENHL